MTSKYRPDIDGLRAIAVLAVVGFHAFGVMGGFTGVDIFFVISGFIISTIIFEDFENKTFTFNDFYQRRVRRIFPSLILVVAASSIFGWFFLFSDEYKQLGKHIGASSGFLSNLVLWNESGYFDVGADKKPFLHLWSLAVEAQFYLFWPIFVWVLWKYKTNKLLILFIILAISFGLNVWNIFSDSTFSFYSPVTRFWELLCGSALAYLLIFQEQFSKAIDSRSNLISILGTLLMLGGIAFLTKELDFPGWWALIPVLGAGLVIATGKTSWIGRKIL
jgi:peptidoglycan/LPS O-acetylase OafA/YrhL